MLHGKGGQFWITKTYEDDRLKALEDRSKYTDTQLDLVDVLDDVALGGGKTDSDSYIIKQFPYPVDASIRRKEKVDLRIVDKTTGGNI